MPKHDTYGEEAKLYERRAVARMEEELAAVRRRKGRGDDSMGRGRDVKEEDLSERVWETTTNLSDEKQIQRKGREPK